MYVCAWDYDTSTAAFGLNIYKLNKKPNNVMYQIKVKGKREEKKQKQASKVRCL